jgi:hypothetical protein
VTSPNHFGKPRPVQTTSDDTKLVETDPAILTEEIPEVEYVEEISNV